MTNLCQEEICQEDYEIEVKCDNCKALLLKVKSMELPERGIEIKCRRCNEYTYI